MKYRHSHGYQRWDATAVTHGLSSRAARFCSDLIYQLFVPSLPPHPSVFVLLCDTGPGSCKLCFPFACSTYQRQPIYPSPLGRLQGWRRKERLSFLLPAPFWFLLSSVVAERLLHAWYGSLSHARGPGLPQGQSPPSASTPSNGWCVLTAVTPSPNSGDSDI